MSKRKPDDLTLRQIDVCGLIVRGRSNKEIAGTLGIKRRTVEAHREVIFRKLGVRNAVELVHKVMEGQNQ